MGPPKARRAPARSGRQLIGEARRSVAMLRAGADEEAGLDASTRTALHVLATHVLGRRRFEVTGRFGLRATPGGFGTPAFGEPLEVVRFAGLTLVHEVGPTSTSRSLEGATLRDLSSFVGVDLRSDFSAGADTPPTGDADRPLRLQPATVHEIAGWFSLGWVALDGFTAGLGPAADPATIQLWPEHFDAGSHFAVPGGHRVNIGFSAGDDVELEPYAYFAPWTPDRPGDPSFWNAPFGALVRAAEVLADRDPVGRAIEFLETGVRNLAAT